MILKELRYILAVREHGTLSGAAESLFISQPALSKYIKNLETYLDVKLFEKVGKRLIPTDAGLKYMDAAQSMLHTFDNMTNELKSSDNLIHGLLRIGTSNSRSPLLLSQTVPRFHELFPNVEIQLFEESSYKLENKLAEGLVDLLVTKGPVTNENRFATLPLFTEEILISLPCGHPAIAHAKTIDNSEYKWLDLSLLADESFVLLKSGQYTRVMADKLFDYYGFFPKKHLATANIETAIRLSANGMGPTFVPSFFAKNKDIQNLNLCFFSVGYDLKHMYSYFNIIYRQDAQPTRYMKCFIELLQDYFGSSPVSP